MTELSGSVLEPLWEDGEFVLSRGVRDGERSPLLVLASTSEQPTPGSLQLLEHSYALREELDPAWAARPLKLVRQQGRPTLLLGDPGGELLARLVGQPWEVSQFLRIAIGLGGGPGPPPPPGPLSKNPQPAPIP